MRHDPLVSIEDALRACRLILEFTVGMDQDAYREDIKTKAAVERCFEILGEALNRVSRIDESLLDSIDDWRSIIGFRNVIAHGYDSLEDEIVWDAVQRNIPELIVELEKLLK